MMNAVEQMQTESGTVPLLDRKTVLHNGRKYWFIRRTQDIVLSAAALLLLWPVMLLVAIIIRLDSPIFVQTRASSQCPAPGWEGLARQNEWCDSEHRRSSALGKRGLRPVRIAS